MGWHAEWKKQREQKKVRRYERAVNTPIPCAGPWGSDKGGCKNKDKPVNMWVVHGKLYCQTCEKGMPDSVPRKRFTNVLDTPTPDDQAP
jgi:hypothetical protein